MPFQGDRCVVDTNVLSDFFSSGCLGLLWQLFPGGVWIDPYVSEEAKVKFGLDVHMELSQLNLAYNFTNNYDENYYVEMGEIKARKQALKHADICCVINAKIHNATCLSADRAVVKTCEERGLKYARHGGILIELVSRNLITKAEALAYFNNFLSNGLIMRESIRDDIISQLSD